MNTTKAHNILVSKERKYENLTFKQLYEDMLSEIDTYEKSGMLDELMKQKVTVHAYDAEGKIVAVDLTDLIGWLENGNVMTIGQVRDVYF
ncbi:hypothetical protein [Paenibacillus sp. Marseille-Q4541]|uniref:hypothetical protein n=1 Tax=Paenibacillus sp. Marseille-Q4541 TaxID=2831522 RepID=UPI001BAE1D25|nr:hypothetical protein [Paenibacillus sp. Marseille-Q4541]